jgi:DNA-binding transcriptional LysR family regulator
MYTIIYTFIYIGLIYKNFMRYYTHLLSFLWVYRTKSFSKAANVLSISQPAVSQHIDTLEHKLDRTLFKRSTRSIKATLLADQLASLISPAFDRLDNAIGSINIEMSSIKRTVFIGASNDILESFVAPKLHNILEQGIEIQLCANTPKITKRLLDDNDLDFALVSKDYMEIDTDIYEEILVCAYDLCLIANTQLIKNFNLQSDQDVLKHCDELPWVEWDQHTYFTKEYFQRVFGKPCLIHPVLLANDFQCLITAMKNSEGITTIPSYLYQHSNRISKIPNSRNNMPKSSIILVCKKNHLANYVHQACIKTLSNKNN